MRIENSKTFAIRSLLAAGMVALGACDTSVTNPGPVQDDFLANAEAHAHPFGAGLACACENRVEVVANGREIDLLMSQGCDEGTPKRAVVNGAGIQLSTLLQNGVLVVKCNDVKIQCLQSTRDADDVLCTTGIRHK